MSDFKDKNSMRVAITRTSDGKFVVTPNVLGKQFATFKSLQAAMDYSYSLLTF